MDNIHNIRNIQSYYIIIYNIQLHFNTIYFFIMITFIFIHEYNLSIVSNKITIDGNEYTVMIYNNKLKEESIINMINNDPTKYYIKIMVQSINQYEHEYDNVLKEIHVGYAYRQNIDIPMNTYKFTCHSCSSFTGYAIQMNLESSQLSGSVHIPDECEVFSIRTCYGVTELTGYAKKIDISGTDIAGIYNIPDGTEIFNAIFCTKLTGFTGYAKIMNFTRSNLTGVVKIDERVEQVILDECPNITKIIANTEVVKMNKNDLNTTVVLNGMETMDILFNHIDETH